MKKLVKLAFENKRAIYLLLFTVVLAWFLQVASMMEMYSIGLLTNNGPDFFALFAPSKKTEKQVSKDKAVTAQSLMEKKREDLKRQSQFSKDLPERITLSDVEEKWSEIDRTEKGFITKQDASDFMNRKSKKNALTGIMMWIKDKYDLSNNVLLLIMMMAMVGVFKVICSFLGRYSSTKAGTSMARDLRAKYFNHLQTLPMSFFQKHSIGALSSRVGGDAGAVSTALIAIIMNYLHLPFVIFSCLFGLFMISVKLSLVIFVGLPLLAFPIYYLSKKTRKAQRKLLSLMEKFSQLLIEYLAGIQTIKLFNMEKYATKKYVELNDATTKIELKMSLYGYISKPILHMIGTLFLAIILIYGLYVVKMHIADLVVYIGLLHLFYEPIKKFAEQNLKIQRGLIAAERMFDVLDIESDIKDKPDAIEFTEFKDEIRFENVWFKYEDQWVLKDMDFTVKKGQTVALVGPTGAGKSTIAQLLPRLYDVNKGRITIDGIPLTDYKQKSVRENISSAPQKPFLFYDTVANNICFGREFPHEDVLRAAKQAHADEFIQGLPKKYNTFLAEMGKNLSGGQQQRLAIARALIKKAPILLMDEATSALDSISEDKIKRAISDLHGHVTQIIIAHRLSTIEDADKIIYMEDGSKVAEGTRQELYKSCVGFKHMWDMMFRREETEREEREAVTVE